MPLSRWINDALGGNAQRDGMKRLGLKICMFLLQKLVCFTELLVELLRKYTAKTQNRTRILALYTAKVLEHLK